MTVLSSQGIAQMGGRYFSRVEVQLRGRWGPAGSARNVWTPADCRDIGTVVAAARCSVLSHERSWETLIEIGPQSVIEIDESIPAQIRYRL